MPVRSLTSSILKWPNKETVDNAVRRWAKKIVQNRPDILQIGYFGSYARGDWGVGSDLDIVIIVERTDKPFEMRASLFDTKELPVPADVLVYTQEEWQNAFDQRSFSKSLSAEVIWI